MSTIAPVDEYRWVGSGDVQQDLRLILEMYGDIQLPYRTVGKVGDRTCTIHWATICPMNGHQHLTVFGIDHQPGDTVDFAVQAPITHFNASALHLTRASILEVIDFFAIPQGTDQITASQVAHVAERALNELLG